MVPKRIFLTKGVGKHKERLTSFELALRDAGIAAQNLVRVSSIFPPHCKLIPRKEGLKYLYPGEVTSLQLWRRIRLANRIGWWLRALDWRFRQIAARSATSANTIPSARKKIWPAITPKNSPRKCWPPRSMWNLTPTNRGTKEGSVPAVQQDRPHHEHDPNCRGRQARPVDDGNRRRHSYFRIATSTRQQERRDSIAP